MAALAPHVASGAMGAPAASSRLEGTEGGLVVVLASWSLVAAGDIFEPTTASAVARHRIGTCRLVLLVLDDVVLDGTPLVDLVRVDATGALDAAVAAIASAAGEIGMPGPMAQVAAPAASVRSSPATATPVPTRVAASATPVPAYADDASRRAGESLLALRSLRARGVPVLDAEIDAAAARLRRGARLRPGEFVDDRTRLLRQVATNVVEESWRAWDVVEQRPVWVRVFLDAWTSEQEDVDALVAATARLAAWDDSGVLRPRAAGRTGDGFVWQSHDPPPGMGLTDLRTRRAGVLQAAIEVARTLARCHAAGIVHGAVAPSTIAIRPDGSAVLHGFVPPAGLRHRSRGGVFEPPEAVAGRPVGPPGDLYGLALGVVAVMYGEDLPLWALRGLDRLIASLPVSERVRKLLATATDWDAERRGEASAFAESLCADADTVSELAEDAVAHGRGSVAIEHLERCLRLRPGNTAAVRVQLAELYTQHGEGAAAETHLVAALRAADDPGAIVKRLLPLLEGRSSPGDIVDLLHQALRTADAPHRVGLLRAELARTLDAVGRHAEAAAAWTEVLDDHRSPALARDALAALVRHGARVGDAALLDRVGPLHVRMAADAQLAARDLSRAWDGVGEPDLALRWLEVAAGGAALEPADRRRLDLLRLTRGRWREAVTGALQSDDADLVGRAAWMAFAAGDLDVAASLEGRWRSLEPASSDAAALHGALTRPRGGGWEAGRLDGTLASLSPEDDAAERARVGRALLAQGSAAEALAAVQGRRLEDHGPCLWVAGSASAALGDPAAVEQWRRVTRHVAGSAQEIEAWLSLADAAWAVGLDAESTDAARRALVAEPMNAGAVWALTRSALSCATDLPVPGRVSPCEPLARRLVAVVDRAALEAWVRQSPWGALAAEHGATPLRLGLIAADLLGRSGRVDAFLALARQRDGGADFTDVELVLEGNALDDRPAVPLPERSALPPVCPPLEDLASRCKAPAVVSRQAEVHAIVALVADGATRAVLLPGMDALQLGTAPGTTCVSDSDQLMPRHARLWRAGPLVYVEALDGGVEVNGRPVGVSRIVAGDALLIGGARVDVRSFATEDDLPPFEVVVPAPRRRGDGDVSDERTDERQAKVQMMAAPPALGQVQLTGELEIRSGPLRGRRQRIAEVVTVGAGPGNVVRLSADDEVDDHHFEIRVEGGRFVLGLRSARGVLVSGRPARDGLELSGGETLMAGRTVLAFKVRATSTAR